LKTPNHYLKTSSDRLICLFINPGRASRQKSIGPIIFFGSHHPPSKAVSRNVLRGRNMSGPAPAPLPNSKTSLGTIFVPNSSCRNYGRKSHRPRFCPDRLKIRIHFRNPCTDIRKSASILQPGFNQAISIFFPSSRRIVFEI